MEWIIVGYSAGWLVTWGMALSVARSCVEYRTRKDEYDKGAIIVAMAWHMTILEVWRAWKE